MSVLLERRWAAKTARTVAIRLGLVIAGVSVALVASEMVARWLIPTEIEAFFTPFEHDDSSYRVNIKDPRLLYTLAWYTPGATGTTGSAPVRINNLGFRDSLDYPLEKPEGCYRILGLGDSMTFGKGVAEEQTYLAVLEQRLKQRFPGRCIEVINAGQPNTNFYTQWNHYDIEWHKLQADLILVGFFVYNDTQLQEEEEPYSQRWMEFIDRNAWLKDLAVVRWAYHNAFFDLGARAMATSLPRFYDKEYKGWTQFRDGVRDLQAMATTHGARVAFALIPIPEGYDEYPYKAYHEQVEHFLDLERKLPVFDLLPGLRGLNARKHWVHPSDAHPDAFVHEQLAIYMTEVMPWGAWLATGGSAP